MDKNKTWNVVWRQFLAPLGLSICLAITFLLLAKIPLAKTWFGMATDPAPEWYMNMYYNTVNDIAVCDDGPFPDIVLLELKESITRKDLASLLEIVSKCSPKVVGVDCAFPISESYDKEQTHSLIQSIKQLPDTPIFVFATILGEESIIPDQFISHKGFVNVQGFYHYDVFRNGIPHLSYEIARQTNYNVNRIDTASFLVNYRKKTFTSIPIYSDFMEDSVYIKNNIQDKIVLIGGLNNRLDLHYSPFTIENEGAMISGSRILTYMLSSVISATAPENYSKYKSFHHYSQCSLWMNALLTIIFTICYLALYIVIVVIKRKYPWFELLKPILMFGMIILVIGLSMVITAKFFYVPHVVFFMALSLFLGFSYDVFNQNS